MSSPASIAMSLLTSFIVFSESVYVSTAVDVSGAKQSIPARRRRAAQGLFVNWAEALRDLPSNSRVFLARCRYRLPREMMRQIPEYLAADGSSREALLSIRQISFSCTS
jgi:hypothetical protein